MCITSVLHVYELHVLYTKYITHVLPMYHTCNTYVAVNMLFKLQVYYQMLGLASAKCQ